MWGLQDPKAECEDGAVGTEVRLRVPGPCEASFWLHWRRGGAQGGLRNRRQSPSGPCTAKAIALAYPTPTFCLLTPASPLNSLIPEDSFSEVWKRREKEAFKMLKEPSGTGSSRKLKEEGQNRSYSDAGLMKSLQTLSGF